jgi:apolipoprotein N-acyltransferase
MEKMGAAIKPDRGVEFLGWKAGLGWAVVAIASFHLAYAFSFCNCLVLLFLFGLAQIGRVRTSRIAMYTGLGLGLCIYGPQLGFFWRIFGPSAIALWLVLCFWLGVFLVLLRQAYFQLGCVGAGLLAPFLWMGVEYFRSELYFLRFSWITPGLAFANSERIAWVGFLGVYGLGFAFMLIAGILSALPRKARVGALGATLVILSLVFNLPRRTEPEGTRDAGQMAVAGMQLEFPAPAEVELELKRLVQQAPRAELIVLSEYTFDGPIPERIKAWCRKHRKYLAAGGKDLLTEERWFNTVFVVNPQGEVIFKQAKSVPIQFFKDGLPAPEQRTWISPWGKLGIAICYDLGYARVMDRFVRQGVQGLIVPTMDVQDWGLYQHKLHARIAPIRAAEYGLPIFRIASSGVSQLVDRHGRTQASGGVPGQKEILAGTMHLARSPRLPWDRPLAPVALGITVIWALASTAAALRSRTRKPGS